MKAQTNYFGDTALATFNFLIITYGITNSNTRTLNLERLNMAFPIFS